ncbi:MAG TPA: DUF2520 domain-containing protein, partial [Conexibacter sp.]|nr:DUF2520 domain-containing protein [Conexibacter sp.]
AAERVGGLDRELLVPLVRATVDNWAAQGARDALTGPIARGDEETVTRQRHAIAERTPDLLPLFDALADATRKLATADRAGGAGDDDSRGQPAGSSPPSTGPARSSVGARA